MNPIAIALAAVLATAAFKAAGGRDGDFVMAIMQYRF